jgi:hypothetical protein
MGSLMNVSSMADQLEHAMKTVRGNRDIGIEMNYMFSRMRKLRSDGPNDQLWQQVESLIKTNISEKAVYGPEDYIPWLESMTRVWFAMCSTRELLIDWANIHPNTNACNINPIGSIISKSAESSDFCDQEVRARLDMISGETVHHLHDNGITSIPYIPAVRWKARNIGSPNSELYIYYHDKDRGLPIGFVRTDRAKVATPQYNTPYEYEVGGHALQIPVVWDRVMYPVEFGITDDFERSVTKEEVALKIAFDVLGEASAYSGVFVPQAQKLQRKK